MNHTANTANTANTDGETVGNQDMLYIQIQREMKHVKEQLSQFETILQHPQFEIMYRNPESQIDKICVDNPFVMRNTVRTLSNRTREKRKNDTLKLERIRQLNQDTHNKNHKNRENQDIQTTEIPHSDSFSDMVDLNEWDP